MNNTKYNFSILGLTAIIPFADGNHQILKEIKGPDTLLLVSNKPDPPRPIMLYVSSKFDCFKNFKLRIMCSKPLATVHLRLNEWRWLPMCNLHLNFDCCLQTKLEFPY